MQYWTELYLELSRKFTGTYIIKTAVANVAALETTYPHPKENWACKVNDTGFIHLYYDNEWHNTNLKEFILNQIKWVDLWHEQVSYLTNEIPFPTPSVFISFNLLNAENKGMKGQLCNTQVDFYLFFETFSDTYVGSVNKDSALDFLKQLTEIHKAFHATSGENYWEMSRVDMKREDSGDAGNLYRISFQCMVDDMSATHDFNEETVTDISISRSALPDAQVEDATYRIE